MSMPSHLTKLVKHYAPVFAHQVDDEWVIADQLAPVDFAGDLSNVAKNLPKFFELSKKKNPPRPDPKVYFSAVETGTHIFLVYAVYHIFDWWKRDEPSNLYDRIRDRLDEHAHDMEGALLVVRKEPENLLDAMVTVSHRDFYLYSEPQRSVDENETKDANGDQTLRIAKFRKEDIDGNVWIDRNTGRAKLFIQAKGHGMRGDHSGWGGGDYIQYYKEAAVQEDPRALNPDSDDKPTPYQLEDIFEPDGLWDHRYNLGTFIQGKNGRWGFAAFDQLTRGDKLIASSANPPWSWDDHNDPSPIGEIATDPARFITRYAQGWGPVSSQYTHNGYLNI